VKNTVTAGIAVHRFMADGTVKERVVRVRPEDRLEQKTGRSNYEPYQVDEISKAGGFVRFANGHEIRLGETQGVDKEAIFSAQIRETIEEHFEKQRRLRRQGIKVLSLFFIDRVSNYAGEDSMIRRLFDQHFDDLKTGHPEWRKRGAGEVQAAYFAERRTREGEVILQDSVTGKAERDRQAYELIMRNKERLLSLEEPVSFIFSHSALREGWDNPNIFQICTLNQTGSEMRKRQELGRGIRLVVNQDGERVRDEAFNLLTVVANESYDSYVRHYQEEVEAEYGRDPETPPIRKKGAPKAKLRKLRALRPEFEALWKRISHKTRYAVTVETEKLLAEVVAELDRSTIPPPRITVTKAQMDVREERREFAAYQTTGTRTFLDLSGTHRMPNLVALMEELLSHGKPPVKLTRRTLLEVFKRTAKQAEAMANPYGFASEAVRIIRAKLEEHLINGIQYEKIGECWEMSRILDEKEAEVFGRHIVPTNRGNSLYSYVACDSSTERDFVQALERRKDVKLYLKLPSWFSVPTPVGEYIPDWAIVMKAEESGQPVVYLVRETKDTLTLDDLRPEERRKVKCGARHFRDALGVNYRVVTSADQLPGGGILP